MKKILFALTAVAVLFGAASCEKENLGKVNAPGNAGNPLDVITVIQNPDSKLAVDADNLTPAFEVNDEIFGWDSDGNTYTYKCTEVKDGAATFGRTSSFAPSAAEGTLVNLVYAPGFDAEDVKDKALDVNLAVQGEKLPVVMHAMGEVDAQGLCEVVFYNDVAIVDIKDAVLPGAAENDEYTIAFHGKYTSLKFALSENGYIYYEVAVEGPISSSVKAKVSADSKVSKRFAVPASLADTDVIITAMAADGSTYGFSAVSKNIGAGKYIKVSGKEFTPRYVAQIGENKYMTLAKAVSAANAATGDVTVKLLNDCSSDEMLVINNESDRKVTLDFDGYTIKSSVSDTAAVRTETPVKFTSSKATTDTPGGITALNTALLVVSVDSEADGGVFTSTSKSNSVCAVQIGSVKAQTPEGVSTDFKFYGNARIVASQGARGMWARGPEESPTTVEISGDASIITEYRPLYGYAYTTVTVKDDALLESTGDNYVVYEGSSYGSVYIQGGYFKNNGSKAILQKYGTSSVLEVSGGHFSHSLGDEGGKSFNFASGKGEYDNGEGEYKYYVADKTVYRARLDDATDYETFDDAYGAAISAGGNHEIKILLSHAMSFGANTPLPENVTLTIDLNGCKLDFFRRIDLNATGSKLIVKDSDNSGNGEYHQTSTSDSYGITVTNGEFVLESGKMTQANEVSVVRVNGANGKFTMKGGFVVNSGTTDKSHGVYALGSGTVEIQSGTIESKSGYAVYAYTGSSLTISGGYIKSTGNDAVRTSRNTSSDPKPKLLITGGTIETTADGKYGIYPYTSDSENSKIAPAEGKKVIVKAPKGTAINIRDTNLSNLAVEGGYFSGENVVSKGAKGVLTIKSGYFTSSVADYVQDGHSEITEGGPWDNGTGDKISYGYKVE